VDADGPFESCLFSCILHVLILRVSARALAPSPLILLSVREPLDHEMKVVMPEKSSEVREVFTLRASAKSFDMSPSMWSTRGIAKENGQVTMFRLSNYLKT